MTATARAALPVTTDDGRHLAGLDGLRGLSAVLVIVGHTLALFAPRMLLASHADLAEQAIVIFFCLSGFLISLPFARRIIAARPAPDLLPYLRARALRIYPAYVVILVAANAAGAVFTRNAVHGAQAQGTADAGTIGDPLRLLLHGTLLQNYVPRELQTGINTTWTLTVEVTFYALMPLLAWGAGALRRARPRWSPHLVAALPGLAMIALGLSGRILAWQLAARADLSLLDGQWGPNGVAVLTRSLATWADDFGMGMLAVVLFLAITSGAAAIPRRRVLIAGIAGVMGALALAAVAFRLAPWLLLGVVGIAASALLLLVALPAERGGLRLVARVLDSPPFRYVGLVSLSLYLVHYPVLLVLHRLGWSTPDTPLGAGAVLLVVLGGSLALASVGYWLVERPFQKWNTTLKARERAR